MIKVFFPISQAHIRAFVDVYNQHFPDHPIIINEQRLEAADGMEIPIDYIVQCETEADSIEYDKFLMSLTSSVINYLLLNNQ